MSLINSGILAELCSKAAECPPGCFVEVGVYRGGSARKLMDVASEQGRTLWLFDTFKGIPERTPGLDRHNVGDFADTRVEDVIALVPEAQFVVGDARETLPETMTGPVAFAHLDCDQYATYKAVIAELLPRMVPGGVFWFDDYEDLEGARKGVDEMFSDVQFANCGKAFKVI